MKIEAITVCVNYSDFLAATLPINRRQFDRLIVVTDAKDLHTHDVSARDNVFTLAIRLCEAGTGVFSKAVAINHAIDKYPGGADWLCILDADVALPFNFHGTIE